MPFERRGYTGRKISFEPLSAAYRELVDRSENEANWNALNIALGEFDGESTINISGNICGSALLDMIPKNEKSAPESSCIDREIIKINRLDTIFDQCCGGGSSLYMKIDTQGYGEQALIGANE